MSSDDTYLNSEDRETEYDVDLANYRNTTNDVNQDQNEQYGDDDDEYYDDSDDEIAVILKPNTVTSLESTDYQQQHSDTSQTTRINPSITQETNSTDLETMAAAAAAAAVAAEVAQEPAADSHLPGPDESSYDIDIDSYQDKPWRRPGADRTDYFNYGLNEQTWKLFCNMQKKVRAQVEQIRAGQMDSVSKALVDEKLSTLPQITPLTLQHIQNALPMHAMRGNYVQLPYQNMPFPPQQPNVFPNQQQQQQQYHYPQPNLPPPDNIAFNTSQPQQQAQPNLSDDYSNNKRPRRN